MVFIFKYINKQIFHLNILKGFLSIIVYISIAFSQNNPVSISSSISSIARAGEVVTIDGGEWMYNAGQFTWLDKVPQKLWGLIEKTIRKKSK